MITRFAPSPTGYLHVGGARTALYSWAHARRHGGKFLLRIEDTDRERSDPAMTEGILDSLRWLGLNWDGDVVFQSERRPIYNELFDKLLAAGLAYECFCSAEEMKLRRAEEDGAAPAFRYDGRCRRLSDAERTGKKAAGMKSAIRLRLPDDDPTIVKDLLRGDVLFEASVLDDLVIRKSDGFPTFHFAVAVDDALMGVTDVIRGDDHLSNTPKQIRILEALEKATGDARFKPPKYAHLPLILGPDGKRFSKRHGATAVGEYRTRGFLPEALVNYLVLLGWSPGDDREVVSLDEIASLFDLGRVNKSGAIFDEMKLEWMNGKYMTEAPTPRIIDLLGDHWNALGITQADLVRWGVTLPLDDWKTAVISLGKTRSRTVPEIIEVIGYFLVDEVELDFEAKAKNLMDADAPKKLNAGLTAIESVPEWTEPALDQAIRAGAVAAGFKAKNVMHPLRVAVTGRAESPGLFTTVFHIGRDRCVQRIRKVLETLS